MIDRRKPQNRRDLDRRINRDRRDVPRSESDAALRFLRAGGGLLSGELLDVSAGGVQVLLLDSPLDSEEALLIEVHGEEGGIYNLTGRVVWCEGEAESGWRIGCVFAEELTDRQFDSLRSQVARPPFPAGWVC